MRVVLLLLTLLASPALAHNIIASGYAAGDNIEGEVLYSTGKPGAGVTLRITGPDGELLGEVVTDQDGLFVFTPTEAVPHYFFGDLGAGHVAKFAMQVADLPLRLRGDVEPLPVSSPSRGDAPVLTEDMREVIAAAVREEVRPLRRELIATREKANLQGILGGIGYILGLAGIGFYVAARRQKKESA